MLKQRIFTAIILAGLFLAGVVYLPITALAIAFAVAAAAGAWEWAALADWRGNAGRAAYTVLTLVLIGALWWFATLDATPNLNVIQPVLGVACLFWSIAMFLIQSYPNGAHWWRPAVIRSLMGWLILGAAWLSFVYILSLPKGSTALVVMVILVVGADIGAYFSGRAFGKHKLAPNVSPGKTWEGFWGGLTAVILLTTAVWFNLPNSYTHLPVQTVALIGVATGGASVVGDLTVSMVKRGSGVKDSGSLLPGHGGVLDRLDSLCAAAPVFALALVLASR